MNEDKIPLAGNWVEKDEKIMAGASRIAGTRIRVLDVIEAREKLNYSPKKIAEEFSISSKEVSKALSYYKNHKEEIENERERIKRRENTERRLKRLEKEKMYKHKQELRAFLIIDIFLTVFFFYLLIKIFVL